MMLRLAFAEWRAGIGLAAILLGLTASAGHAQDRDRDDACATIVRALEDLPTPALEIENAIIHDERTGSERPGCRITMAGSMRAFRDGPSPDEHLRTILPTIGWEEDWHYGADGPDGTATAFRRGAALCLLRAQWDGGDDTDSTYVPNDRYDLTVGCMAVPPSGQDLDQMP